MSAWTSSVVYTIFVFVNSLCGSVTRAGKSPIKSEIIAKQRPLDLFPLIEIPDCTQQLAEELLEILQLLQNLKNVYSSFEDNIWGADLANMQLRNKYYREFRFLLCIIDIFSKYVWVVPLKNNTITITNAFQKVLDESNHKSDKTWVNNINWGNKDKIKKK